jgi:hypothetical protein
VYKNIENFVYAPDEAQKKLNIEDIIIVRERG